MRIILKESLRDMFDVFSVAERRLEVARMMWVAEGAKSRSWSL